ncbi:MAG TPA: cytochrome c5 family protein [Gammaproteobacteria bacterium]|nr:cytochrome c5 family protein [Gammaproteobacteria bacterium]
MKRIHVFSVMMLMSVSVTAASSGVSVYQGSCIACHNIGVAGAPRLGDKQAWQPRIDQGMEVLVQHALTGFKSPGAKVGMPAKGGKTSLSEADIRAAVGYMVSQSK